MSNPFDVRKHFFIVIISDGYSCCVTLMTLSCIIIMHILYQVLLLCYCWSIVIIPDWYTIHTEVMSVNG